jgi:tetratricopeptide (TPR) repeat protein
MRLSLVGSVTALVALLVGCKVFDTPTFQNNYFLYNREAVKAERENNWDAAAKRYFLALQNSEWAEEGKGVRSDFHYKLGRAQGATCQFDKSAQSLNEAYTLNNLLPQALAELGRLNLAQNKFPEALGYFERAMPELAKANVGKSDPIGYADILDDYKVALLKSGKPSDATRIAKEAEALRSANGGKTAAMIRAPYGAQCPAPKTS